MNNKNKQLWLLLWQRTMAQGNQDKIYNNLVRRYSEPHRSYHTLRHIEHCFDEFKQVQHLAVNPDVIEWALWYHDAIYDTKAKDNEEKSARLAIKTVKNVALPDNFGQSVANLIIATKHFESPSDPDSKLIVDVDLSILGQSKEKFDQYEQLIRKEYEWVSINTFIKGRSTILKSFLTRQTIYSTRFFRDKYEMQARQNIIRSLEKLSDSILLGGD